MEFKKGDKVRVKRFKKRPITWNSEGKMDHLMGKVVEVTSISIALGGVWIYDDLHDETWLLDESQVELVELVEKKKKQRFKVGDRVKCVKDGGWDKRITGKAGTIVCCLDCGGYSVNFDEYIDGHACSGKAEFGHGWNCEEDMLKPLYESIIIYRNGMTVIAKDNATGKKAVAHCNPVDKFDFATGAKLAFDRLLSDPDNIAIGDMVRVVNTNVLYTTNVDKVIEMTNEKSVIAKYTYGNDKGYGKGVRKLDDVYKVLNIDGEYVLIQKTYEYTTKCGGEVLLIGKQGLEKC